jgi:hypothetical protein
MRNESVIQAVREYMFPALVSIVSVMIWYDVTEIKKDLKALMAQSNIDKTRIDNLEKQLDRMQTSRPLIFPKPTGTPVPHKPRGEAALFFGEWIPDTSRRKGSPQKDTHKNPHTHV